ncbi:MAG: hypothetical protein AAF587_11450 [Bacteroidota bacterium]
MKRSVFLILTPLAICLLFLSSCIQDNCSELRTYYEYQPVYESMNDLRDQVGVATAQELKMPGKIYFYGQYILINEVGKGYHVIDNTDPKNPSNIAFIEVPGARDMAVKGNMLFADSYLDLVVIDINNPQSATEVSRRMNVFEYGSYHPGLWADESQGIATDWVETRLQEEFDCGFNNWGRNRFVDFVSNDVAILSSNSEFASPSVASGSDLQTGVGGSMARFTLVNDYLYAVTNTNLIPFDISTLTEPVSQSPINVGWNIETIFPMKDHLFIGSQTGMFVYNLVNPNQPSFVSEFQHVRSCDPVVVEGDYAFVTLRNGNGETACGGFANELSVVDISNLSSPFSAFRYDMHNPHGLGIKDGILFICDGEDGLKVFDASDVSKIHQNQLAHFPGIHAFDVIPLTTILLMIGDDGFYQYDYSDLNDIHQISKIPVVMD